MKLRIKEVAKEKNISIKEIANKIGVTSPAISQNVAGRMNLDRLQEIADVLGVSPIDLIVYDKTFGVIHHNGDVYSIDSVNDIENALKKIKSKANCFLGE